jgi:hypothetical protein
MNWRRGKSRTWIVGGLLLSTVVGCSSSDPIQPNNGNVTLLATPAPAYADQYQWARMQIDQITVRPLDPLVNSYLAIPLGLLQAPEPFDVRSTAPVTIGIVPLKVGSYVVENIRISGLSLNLPATAPQAPVGCSGSDLVSVRVAGALLMSFPTPQQIQVSVDGTSTLSVVVDGPGLVTMLTNQPYTCGAQTFPPPTSAQLAQFISVN